METLINWDRALFLAINAGHRPWLDPVMRFFSNIPVWIPLYALLIFFFFYKRPWRAGLLALACVGLCFALTDHISASVIKEAVARLRPGHDPLLQDTVRLLEGKGGLYGFVSSHAANTFGLACFCALFYKRKWVGTALFVWAAWVSYSRIYVGKHFPLDVLCGALLGLLVGWGCYALYAYLCRRLIK